jgi:PAS domain S-box-containing protein
MNYLKQEFYQILKSDEKFFDFIQINAFDGVWFWNLENPTDKWINPKFCHLLGYEYEELQGNQIQKIVHQDDQVKIKEIFDKYLTNTSSVHEDEIRFVHKGGKAVWLKIKALIFEKREDKKSRVLVTHTNVTQQHNKEENLENTLDRYESILNNHSTFILRTNLEGKYTYANDYFCEHFGVTLQQALQMNSLETILPEDHAICIDVVQKSILKPNTSFFVQLRKPKDFLNIKADFVYTDWDFRGIADKEGNVFEIQCVGINVTEKIEAEKQKEAKTKELTHTQRLLKTSNENAKIGIWELDIKTSIVRLDKIVREIHEVDEDFVANGEFGISLYEKEDQKRIKKCINLAMQEGVSYDDEFRFTTYRGNKRWIRTTGVPVMENGYCVELYGTFQDITIQKETELQLKEKVNELETSQNQLIHTQKLLDTSNEAAQIGTWELNLNDFTTKWNKVTKEIHEVNDNFVSTPENGILFYKEGYSRDTIAKVFTKALEEGIPFDEQLKLITAKGNEIWVRSIGIPTFENGKCIEMLGTFQDITTQKEAELQIKEKVQELETSQNQLIHTQKLLDTSNEAAQIGTWELNLNDFTTKWNKVTKEIHEVNDNFVSTPENGILFYKEGYSRDTIAKVFTKALENGIPFDEQLKIITTKGNEIWVRAIGIPTFENGKCTEMYGTFQNITDQKEAELQIKDKVEELEITQNQLIHTQKLLDASNKAAQIGTWELNLNDFTTKWNRVTKEIHEVDDNFVSTPENGILFYKEVYSRDTIAKVFTKALENGIPFDEQLKLITAKGNEIWVRAIGIPTFENGKCTEMYGTFQNITDQKEAELQIKDKVEELEITQNQLIHTQKLLDASNKAAQIGTWELNLNDFTTKWNRVTKEIHEVDDNFVSTPENGILFFKEGYSRQIITRVFTKALEEGISYDEQLKLITAKGNEIWARVIGIPTFENGKCIELYGTIQNIDKQKRNEIDLQEKLEELGVSQKHLLSTSKLLETCNASAAIGTWNYDINTKDIIWDTIIHNIYELPIDVELDALAKINFFKKGDNRNRVVRILEEAREQGVPFDEQLELINFRGNHKWVRIIGLPQMEDGRCVELYGTFQDITSQKEAELQLKEKVNELEKAQQEIQKIQTKLSTTLEKTGVGLWEIDIKTNKVYWDKQTRKLLGVQENLLVEGVENAYKYIKEEDVNRGNDLLRDFISQKIETYGLVYQTLPINEKVYFQESKAVLVKDEEGNPVSVLGITQDITQQKEHEKIIEKQNQDLEASEKELRKGIREMYHLQKELEFQKQQLEQIFDAVPAMIYQFKRDEKGNVFFPLVSRGSELILGVRAGEIFNNNSNQIFEAIHPEDLLGFQNSIKESAETMQKWESELCLQKNGKDTWVHATSKPTHMDDGGIIWTGIMQNIDNLKQTELKVQQKNKQLQETLNELQETQSQLIHNEKMTTLGQLVASIAHEINTPLGAIHSSTESIERVLANTLSNLPNIIKILSDQQLELFNQLVEKAVRSNSLYTPREKRSIKYNLIEELDTRKIPQSDRIADLLVDMGIHQEKEIYEPFIGLSDTVKILQAAYEVSIIAKSNQTVRIATDKASKIITTLKNFSRQDHTGEKQPTNINESLQNTLVLYHNKLKYGIEVVREMGILPLINTYEDELAQVWTNLLHNAIQAIEKKGKIYLTTKKQENKILVSIKDTGKGIPDEVQSRVFDAFFTTKPTGEGSGLGLNIVRKIVEKHDGKIWFETENIGEDTGTTFFVELPIK